MKILEMILLRDVLGKQKESFFLSTISKIIKNTRYRSKAWTEFKITVS